MSTTSPKNSQHVEGTTPLVTDRGNLNLGIRRGAEPEPVLFEGFEELPLAITETGDWARVTPEAYEGSWSFKAASVLDGGTSQTVVDVPPGATFLSFYYKVSSEEFFDFFEVDVDASMELQDSGEVDWTYALLDVTGATTVTFRYIKDGSASAGDDTAWIDNLSFLPSAPSEDLYIPHTMTDTERLRVDAEISQPVVIDDSIPVEVTVTNPVDVVLDEPVDVNITGGTVCIDDCEGSITVDGTVSIDDSIPVDVNITGGTVCIDDCGNSITVDDGGGSLTVDGTVDANITGTVTIVTEQPLDAGVPGVVVPGSRWQRTGFLSIGLGSGTLTVQSPIPAGNQRVVIDWWDYNALVTVSLLGLLNSQPRIRETATPANIHWQSTVGVAASGSLGSTVAFETSRHIIMGPVGARLELVLPITGLVSLDLVANMGGYLVSV